MKHYPNGRLTEETAHEYYDEMWKDGYEPIEIIMAAHKKLGNQNRARLDE